MCPWPTMKLKLEIDSKRLTYKIKNHGKLNTLKRKIY